MFPVKISYHHQRRLAIHYRMEALLNDSWVASPAQNPLLSAWSSLVWRWTLNTRWFFEPNLCCTGCNSTSGRGSARSSFFQLCRWGIFKNSASFPPPPPLPQLFFPWDPVGNILTQLWVFLWPLRWERKSWGCAHPTFCSQNQPSALILWGSAQHSPSEPKYSTHPQTPVLWFPLYPLHSTRVFFRCQNPATKGFFFAFKMYLFPV